jgi:hypothetical protein
LPEEIQIAPADPLNLTGIVLPGPRTGSLTQVPLTLVDGVPQEQTDFALDAISALAAAGENRHYPATS